MRGEKTGGRYRRFPDDFSVLAFGLSCSWLQDHGLLDAEHLALKSPPRFVSGSDLGAMFVKLSVYNS